MTNGLKLELPVITAPRTDSRPAPTAVADTSNAACCGGSTSTVQVGLDVQHASPFEPRPATRPGHRLPSSDRRVALLQPRIPDGNYLPNLGIMYLAGILLEKGYDVRIFDVNIDEDAEPGIRRFAPSLLGITCVTAALGSAVRMARRLKDALPEMVVALGGPHPTVMPKETLERNGVADFCFIGESERSFAEFCDRMFESGGDLSAVRGVPGMAWRDDHGVVHVNRSPGYLEDNELDALPYPPWHLLPMERIFKQATHGLFTRGSRIMPVMTTRGCPNYCTF